MHTQNYETESDKAGALSVAAWIAPAAPSR